MASIFQLETSPPPLSYLPVRRCNWWQRRERDARGKRREVQLSEAEDLWDSTRISGHLMEAECKPIWAIYSRDVYRAGGGGKRELEAASKSTKV
jgi:hypothetical protein